LDKVNVVNVTIVEEVEEAMEESMGNVAVAVEDTAGTQVDVDIRRTMATRVAVAEDTEVGPKEAYTVGPKVEDTEVGPIVADTRVGPKVVPTTKVGPKVLVTEKTSIEEVMNLTVDLLTMRVAEQGLDSDADSLATAVVETLVDGEYLP
jgi:hypothetical protein